MTEEVTAETQPTTLSQPLTQPQWFKYVPFILAGLLLLAGTTYAGYWYGIKSSNLNPPAGGQISKPQSKTQIQETPTPTPTPMVEDETEGWKTYVDDRYEYSIKYPSDWSLEPTPSGMGAVTQISKGEAKIEIGVFMEELQQGQTLEEWIRDYPSLYEEKDITVLSQTSVVVGGITGIKRVSRLLDQDESLMVYIPRGSKVYFLSGGKELLTTFKNIFDQFLSTFKFLD